MNNEQMVRFLECSTISIVRECSEFYGMNQLWFVAGDCADWIGYQDDFGSFVPVDWC